MLIDCDTCAVRGPACSDCVVGVLLGTAADLDDAERSAVTALAAHGLIPPLRLVPVRTPRYAAGSAESDAWDDYDVPGASTA